MQEYYSVKLTVLVKNRQVPKFTPTPKFNLVCCTQMQPGLMITTYVYTYIHEYIHTYKCMYVHIYKHTNICIHPSIHPSIHTYIHQSFFQDFGQEGHNEIPGFHVVGR